MGTQEQVKTEAETPKTEETPKQETQEAKETKPVEQPPAEEKATKDEGYQPLFESEQVFSEAELSGEETPPVEEKKEAAPSKPEGQETDATPPKEEQPKEQETTAAETKPEETTPDEKPPAGFVPYASLHEERMKRQEAQKRYKAEMADLQAEVKALKLSASAIDTGEFKDFEVLSDRDFEQLAVDDPAEAVVYERKLRRYERFQEAKTAKEAAAKRAEERAKDMEQSDQEAIKASWQRLQANVPDLNEVRTDLANFAIENGFDPNFLPVMTNPATKIITDGAENPVVMGDGAATLVTMISNLHKALKTAEQSKTELEATLRTELTKEITEKVSKDLLEKFKQGPEFKSIEDLPGAEEAPDTKKILSESEWKKLPEEERARRLGA